MILFISFHFFTSIALNAFSGKGKYANSVIIEKVSNRLTYQSWFMDHSQLKLNKIEKLHIDDL